MFVDLVCLCGAFGVGGCLWCVCRDGLVLCSCMRVCVCVGCVGCCVSVWCTFVVGALSCFCCRCRCRCRYLCRCRCRVSLLLYLCFVVMLVCFRCVFVGGGVCVGVFVIVLCCFAG